MLRRAHNFFFLNGRRINHFRIIIQKTLSAELIRSHKDQETQLKTSISAWAKDSPSPSSAWICWVCRVQYLLTAKTSFLNELLPTPSPGTPHTFPWMLMSSFHTAHERSLSIQQACNQITPSLFTLHLFQPLAFVTCSSHITATQKGSFPWFRHLPPPIQPTLLTTAGHCHHQLPAAIQEKKRKWENRQHQTTGSTLGTDSTPSWTWAVLSRLPLHHSSLSQMLTNALCQSFHRFNYCSHYPELCLLYISDIKIHHNPPFISIEVIPFLGLVPLTGAFHLPSDFH